MIRTLLVVLATFALSGCSAISIAPVSEPRTMAWDGLGISPSAFRRSNNTLASAVEPTKAIANNFAEAELLENARFDQLNKVLVICRGC